MITTTEVIYEVADAVATITLNRPDDLNTMGGSLVPLALEAMGQAAADDGVPAVILTGAGRAFCAGGDLRGMRPPIGGAGPPTLRRSIAPLRPPSRPPKPSPH